MIRYETQVMKFREVVALLTAEQDSEEEHVKFHALLTEEEILLTNSVTINRGETG
jgi:hypothetical protein